MSPIIITEVGTNKKRFWARNPVYYRGPKFLACFFIVSILLYGCCQPGRVPHAGEVLNPLNYCSCILVKDNVDNSEYLISNGKQNYQVFVYHSGQIYLVAPYVHATSDL